MKSKFGHRLIIQMVWVITATIFLSIGGKTPIHAHGPKGHQGISFTALAAAKKGLDLYDKLVANGKLEESWETTLSDIKVHEQNQSGKREFKVQFDRSSGNPRSVFIFFDKDGNYTGSNFTGE